VSNRRVIEVYLLTMMESPITKILTIVSVGVNFNVKTIEYSG